MGRGQAEREFKVEVEAIGRVRHKNLVRLLGYCAEGAYRLSTFPWFAIKFEGSKVYMILRVFNSKMF